MKTSNKLLILLLVLLFSIPLVMISGLKAAIQKNRYVIKNFNSYEGASFKNVHPFKAIKINGGMRNGNDDFGLTCNIRPGSQYGYKFNNYNPLHAEEGRTDSCTVMVIKDTLFISYHIAPAKMVNNKGYSVGVEMDISIPETVLLLINAARVNIDSSAARFSTLNFELSGNTLLNIGTADSRTAGNSNTGNIIFPGIMIDASASQINLNGNSTVKHLQVGLKEHSGLHVNETAVVDTLSGSISDESVINAPYNLVKKLKQ